MNKLREQTLQPLQLNIDLILEGFTQSEIQLLDDCGQAWDYRYNKKLEPTSGFSWALVYGKWFHDFLEDFYRTKGKRAIINPVKPKHLLGLSDMSDFEWWSTHAKIQAEAYAAVYAHDHKNWKTIHTEHIADIMFKGIRLKGMLDLLIEDSTGIWIVDHKTCSRLDANTANAWQYRLQFMFYLWLAKKVWPEIKIKGFKVNAIKKCALQQKQAESDAAFFSRFRADIQDRPLTYFYRETFPLMKGDLKRFEEQILGPKLDRIKIGINPDSPQEYVRALFGNRNTNHCFAYHRTCPYLNLCKGEEYELGGYTVREAKHQELSEGED